MANKELLDRSQADQALRDLMPVIEWLTNADAAEQDGAMGLHQRFLGKAYQAFCRISPISPSIKAYMRWLEENTKKQTDQQKG